MTDPLAFDFSGHTVLISGASRGIGAATARAFAAQGAAVALLARDADALAELAAQIEAEAGASRTLVLPTDITDAASVAQACARATRWAGQANGGGIDALVSNAGAVDPIGHLADTDPQAWARGLGVNLLGHYHLLHALLPGMAARGCGSVVHISTGAANGPMEGWSQYCAAKAGAQMLTRCADKEYRGAGLRIVGLSPGTVATQMQREIRDSGVNPVSQLPWERHIPPEWVARAVLYLCTPAGDDWRGEDFPLKTRAGREALGLPCDDLPA